jgi:hypothetical protein
MDLKCCCRWARCSKTPSQCPPLVSLSQAATPIFYHSHTSAPQPSFGNLTTNWLSTKTVNDTVNENFAKARNATYYTFDEEFYTILGGPSPDIEEVASGPKHLYYEGGGWLFDRNEVWMASEIPTVISVLNLETYRTTTLDIPALRDTNPVGFDYHDGLVYVACAGNETTPNGALAVYAVDPGTLEVTPILNDFFGLRTLVANDITIVKPNTAEGATSCTVPGETNIFFTSFSLGSQGFPFTLPETLPNAVWRFSPQTQSLRGAIARADVKSPNGICVDPSGRYLRYRHRCAAKPWQCNYRRGCTEFRVLSNLSLRPGRRLYTL